MKRSIDLTDNFAFSGTRQDLVSLNKSKHERKPWKNDSVNKKKYSILNNNNIYHISREIINFIGTYSWTSSDSIYTLGDSFRNDTRYINDITNMYYKNDKYNSINDDHLYSEFPTGYQYEIQEYRRCINKENKNKKYNLICRCSKCNKKYIRYNHDDSFYRCNNCISKNILSISKNISVDFRKLNKRKEYQYKDAPWSYEYEKIDIPLKRKAVHYKNIRTSFRSESWQPKGRVPQPYDELFDSLNWRDLIKNITDNILDIELI